MKIEAKQQTNTIRLEVKGGKSGIGIDTFVDIGSLASVVLEKDDTLYVAAPYTCGATLQIISRAKDGKLCVNILDPREVHDVSGKK